MPYIQEDDREYIDPEIERISWRLRMIDMDEREGPANYTITRILAQAFNIDDSQIKYKHLNRAIGVLEAVKLELYRRAGSPYEDRAIEKNGDIPEYKTFVADVPQGDDT